MKNVRIIEVGGRNLIGVTPVVNKDGECGIDCPEADLLYPSHPNRVYVSLCHLGLHHHERGICKPGPECPAYPKGDGG